MLVFIYVVVAEVMVIMIKMLRQTSSTVLFCIAPTFECRTLLQETVKMTTMMINITVVIMVIVRLAIGYKRFPLNCLCFLQLG